MRIDRKILRSAFSDLVVNDQLLDQLGPALISQNSIFVYGPTGNGKTSLAERMLRVYQDAVLMPYAVEVDNQVISLYDPVVHQKLGMDDPDVDPRWVLCRRPCIVVGGELIPSMLELRLDEASGIYAAPLQMKANNGIFIIDDFGRQLMSPRDLLNRWIVPLDRRVDYLMLRYGVKFQIPFELMVVFSTNLEPSDLADEAFLRRIHNKIFVDAVDEKTFDQIFHRVVTKFNIPCEPDSAEYLRKLCLREGRTELRACYPGRYLHYSYFHRQVRRPAAVHEQVGAGARHARCISRKVVGGGATAPAPGDLRPASAAIMKSSHEGSAGLHLRARPPAIWPGFARGVAGRARPRGRLRGPMRRSARCGHGSRSRSDRLLLADAHRHAAGGSSVIEKVRAAQSRPRTSVVTGFTRR